MNNREERQLTRMQVSPSFPRWISQLDSWHLGLPEVSMILPAQALTGEGSPALR